MKLLSSLVLIAVAAAALTRIRKVHHARGHASPAAKLPEVQTWEGEGGGLPEVSPAA